MLYVSCFNYFISIKRAEVNPIQTNKGRKMHCKMMAGVMHRYILDRKAQLRNVIPEF